jgi:O-antigen ligase
MKKLLSLENLIYLTIILLPAYLLRFTILGLPTNFLECLIGLVFVWWLAEYFFSAETRLGPGYPNEIIFSIFLILAGLVISALANPYPAAGLGIIKSWFVLPWLLVFVIYAYVPENRLINIFRSLYLSSFGVALISLAYLLAGRLTYDGRLEAFFNSPNYLAMYLAPGLIIILAQAQGLKLKYQNYNSKFKVLAVLSFAVISLAFYFTYSYAAWLAAAGSVLAIFLVQKNISWKKIGIGAAVIILLALSQLNSPKFSELVTLNPRSSAASRVMIWRAAGKIIADHWLAGIGPGNFQMEYLAYQKYFPPYLEWAVPHPQNVYLAFWLSGGILGMLGFLGLIYFFFREFFAKTKETRQSACGTRQCLVSTIVLGIMVYILVHGLVDTTIFKNDLAVVFGLCFLAVG